MIRKKHFFFFKVYWKNKSIIFYGQIFNPNVYSLHFFIQGHIKKYIVHLYKATNTKRDIN